MMKGKTVRGRWWQLMLDQWCCSCLHVCFKVKWCFCSRIMLIYDESPLSGHFPVPCVCGNLYDLWPVMYRYEIENITKWITSYFVHTCTLPFWGLILSFKFSFSSVLKFTSGLIIGKQKNIQKIIVDWNKVIFWFLNRQQLTHLNSWEIGSFMIK